MDESESIKQKEKKPYILYVCKRCGSLCLTFPEFFIENYNDSRDTSSIIINSFENEIPEEMTFSTDSGSHDKLEIFEELKSFFIDPFFPVCNVCAADLTQKVKSRIKFYNAAELSYSRFDIPDKTVFSKQLESEVNELKEQNMKLKLEMEKNKTFKPDITETEIQPIHDNSLKNNRKYSFMSSFKVTPGMTYFKSIMLPVTFKISVSRHYATINSRKLGQNNQKIINYEEINQALYFLAQLIKISCLMANVDSSSILINNNVTIILEDNSLVSLNSNDMKKRNTVHRFNRAIHSLFSLSKKLFQSPASQNGSMRPPYMIHTDTHQISKENYLFDYSQPSKWIQPMKFLLTDYKFLLAFGLNNAVLEIDSEAL